VDRRYALQDHGAHLLCTRHPGRGDERKTMTHPLDQDPHEVRRPDDADARAFDVVIVSDFMLPGGTTASNISEVRLLTASGKRVGLFHHARRDYDPPRSINPKVVELVDGDQVAFVAADAKVRCDLLLMRFPPFASHLGPELPAIEAKRKLLVVNQTPVTHYGGAEPGAAVWDVAVVHANLREWIGDHEWIAAGPRVRDALLDHHAEAMRGVPLADWYWYPVIDTADLLMRADRPVSQPIRIGRHSRDDITKWPVAAATLRACYPGDSAFEVHVLGGAVAPRRILGEVPANWTVHEFNALTPGEFLSQLDFFVYYPDPSMLEAFGMAPAEAMAAGVPTVLPPVFAPVFGDGAVYAEPEEVRDLLLEIANDPDRYAAVQQRGLAVVHEQFGPAAQRARFTAMGVPC
jgi:hypothetical protein